MRGSTAAGMRRGQLLALGLEEQQHSAALLLAEEPASATCAQAHPAAEVLETPVGQCFKPS